MQLLDLYAGRAFRMGKGSNWRIVHPEMGARRLTLNHGLHEPGQEFTQHLHDESEDMIVVLEGGGALRQGDTCTPIEAGEGIFVPVGEVHGTVNDSGAPARLISFQAPPDPALYAGKRDHGAGASPLPPAGHRSEVRIFTLAKGGPTLGQPGDWRCVVSEAQGARHLGLDYIGLPAHEDLSHTATSAEDIRGGQRFRHRAGQRRVAPAGTLRRGIPAARRPARAAHRRGAGRPAALLRPADTLTYGWVAT